MGYLLRAGEARRAPVFGCRMTRDDLDIVGEVVVSQAG